MADAGSLLSRSGPLPRGAARIAICLSEGGKLPADLNLDELKRRLREGDYLEISTGGGAYEVWAEPLGNPPAVYYEGEQHPLAQLDSIADKIFREMHAGEISCRWVEDD